jgi:hypothetical protein
MAQNLMFLLIFFLLSGQQYKLVKVKIDKKMSVKLPADFSPVPESELGTKYISYRSPIALYSNSTKEVDFSVNYSVSRWQSSDLEIVQSFYKSNIANLFDSIEFIEESIEEINDRRYIIFEFTSSISETQSVLRQGATIKKYYYIQYTLMEGHVLIFSFSCPQRVLNEWQSVAQEIMHTLKIDW